ncbi:MAG: hypothetical protein CMF31_01615 [Kordiimonas sp.]|nr:hypothetical protein [Kordiimonas sp.]|tara:strand:- start:506 stop:1135 length:630 start_codon:yes stop_codon:yes gene_type:complete
MKSYTLDKKFLSFRRAFAKIRHHEKGSVLVELAMMLPVTLMLALGGFELYRFLLIQQKITQTTMSLANLISQNQMLTGNIIQNTFDAVDHIMEPYDIEGNGKVIITTVVGNGGDGMVDYQCSPAGNYDGPSKVGTTGSTANLGILGTDFTLDDGETTVIAELYYDYKPFLANGGNFIENNVFTDTQLYKVAAYKPRFGSLPLTDSCDGA